MYRDKQHFLNFLAGQGTVPVLFEPFFSQKHTETLIWRRGEHLWNTPQNALNTLTFLTERTQADVVFMDIRQATTDKKKEILSAISVISQDNPIGYGVICDHHDIELCEGVEEICCLCVYGNATSSKYPIIRMDGSIEDAIARGDCGWFCTAHAEEYLHSYGDKIRILGGLGVDTLIDGSPVAIYERIEKIARDYPQKWACGSGGLIPDDHYLELISMLGAFARIR